MLRTASLVLALVALFAIHAWADVELFTGESVAGNVVKTSGSRVFVRVEGGQTRSYLKRDVRSAVDAEGEDVSCLIELADTRLAEADKARLRQVTDVSEVLMDPRLSKLLDDCSLECFEELRKLATDPSSGTRVGAIGMLSLAGAPEAVRELVRVAVEDPDPTIRFAAANGLMRDNSIRVVKAEDLLDAIKKGFEDTKPNVRFCLGYVIGKLGDAAAVPVLQQSLENADHHFRESAALSLAELGDDSGLSILLKIVKSAESEREQIAICRALGGLRAKKALPALKRLEKSKSPAVAAAAKAAIESIQAKDEG